MTPESINYVFNELSSLGLIIHSKECVSLTQKGRDQIKIFKASNPEMYFLVMLGFHLIQESKK